MQRGLGVGKILLQSHYQFLTSLCNTIHSFLFTHSLGLGKYQLITNQRSNIQNKGIMLPLGFIPDESSILIEPSGENTRAVLLLTSKCSIGLNYLVCQLQTTKENDTSNDLDELRVIGTIVCTNTLNRIDLPCTSSITDSVSGPHGTFLAGANFFFDHLSSDHNIQGDNDVIATIGVMHNLGQCLTSVEVSRSGEMELSNVVDFQSQSSTFKSIQVIEKLWLSELIQSDKNHCNTISVVAGEDTYVWSVSSNGKFDDAHAKSPNVIGPIQLFPDDDPEKCKIFLGPLPAFVDQFLIYSTQDRRKCQSTESGIISIFGLSDLIVGAPSFTPCLALYLTKLSIDSRVSFLTFWHTLFL